MHENLEQEKIGRMLAVALGMRPDREHHGRFLTAWGNKTPMGVYATLRRIGIEIENGTILTSGILADHNKMMEG
jgi:hypothetical protein